VPAEGFPGTVVGRISFFVNAGIRFVTELCKMRAFVDLWDEIGRERYGVTDDKHRRFRYGVQVNSLGLTEQQPENNVYRILHRGAGRHAVERTPAPARAAARLERGARPAAPLGPAMVAAHAADPRLRDRPARIRRPVRRLPVVDRQGRRAEGRRPRRCWPSIDAMGGAVDGHRLHEIRAWSKPIADRLKEIESGRQIVVGVNRLPPPNPRRSPPATARSCSADHGAEAARSPA
jgi:(2R)-ethylmalonyl-CoA mutase